jgi:hypothetical protein
MDTRRVLNINLTANPQVVDLCAAPAGKMRNARIAYFTLANAGVAPLYYQVDFGDAIHKEFNLGFGLKPFCVQVPVNSMTQRMDIPIRFRCDEVPKNFVCTVFNPTEAGVPVTLAAGGALITIEYDFQTE